MNDNEEGERGDVVPEAICADAGKSQEDLAEEGENEREGGEIEGEIDDRVELKMVEEVIFTGDEECDGDCKCAECSCEYLLYAQNEEMLRDIGANEDQIEDKIRDVTEEYPYNLEGLKIIWDDPIV